MHRVIIESPFRGKTTEEAEKNIKYARVACIDAVFNHQEVPFASHLFFTQFLDDNKAEEREMGIQMGYDFWEKADKIIFYLDLGMSSGMKDALARAVMEDKPWEKRYLFKEHEKEPYVPAKHRQQHTSEQIATEAEGAVAAALGG